VGYFEKIASTNTNCRVDFDRHSLKEFRDEDEMMKMMELLRRGSGDKSRDLSDSAKSKIM
jgi:hypothetical protein